MININQQGKLIKLVIWQTYKLQATLFLFEHHFKINMTSKIGSIVAFIMLLQTILSCTFILQYSAGGTCCSITNLFCGSCVSSTTSCTTCMSNSFCLDSNRCPTCSSKLTGCSTCSSCTVCLTCSSNQYVLVSPQCLSCGTLMTGCKTCSSTTTCLTCVDNTYFLSGAACTLCSSVLSDCMRCTSSTVCSTCVNNTFTLNPTTCTACSSLISDCLQCSSPTACTKCVDNTFTVNSGSCTLCSTLITGCLQCSSPTVCTLCVTINEVFDSGSNACGPCSQFLADCTACSSSTVCTACTNNSLAINSSNLCSACSSIMTDCVTCSSSTVCLTCINNTLTVSSSTHQCVLCSSLLTGCQNCDSSSICTSCVDNTFVLNSSTCVSCSIAMTGCMNCTSTTLCTVCVDNTYALKSISQCQLCSTLMPNCNNCSSQSICINCVNTTFYLNSSQQCSLCLDYLLGCKTCSSSSVCTACTNNSYTMNATSSQCVSCSTLISLCQTCSNDTACLGCQVSSSVVLNNQQCSYCSDLITNCLNCTTPSLCTACKKYYTITQTTNSSICTLCGYLMAGCIDCTSKTVCIACTLGHVTTNGCSNVAGCTSVAQTSSAPLCTSCNPTEFYIQPVNGTCICLIGHLVGQYCTKIVGCISIIRTNSGDLCQMCDKSNHFNLQQGQCVCEDYYSYNGVTCTDTCGDGRVISLPCDDGNLIDGDGCSSTCQIQPNYICVLSSLGSPSKCIYKGWIKLQLSCIYKPQDNKAQIILIFSPFVSNILKSSFVNRVNFTADKNCLMTSFQLVGHMLYINIDYFEDIEGSTAKVVIEYDQDYILSPKGSLKFLFTECEGDKLLYDSQPGKSYKNTIVICVKLLSALVTIVWIFGSYSHKMIGLQTLHTFQLILITQIFSTRYSPVVVNFVDLNSTLNLYQSTLRTQSSLNLKPYNRLKYSADFTSNHFNVSLAQLIVLILFGLCIVLVRRSEGQNDATSKKKEVAFTSKLRRFKKLVYDFLVFPTVIGFYLNFVLSLIVYSNFNNSKAFGFPIQALLILLVSVPTSLIFFSELKYLFLTNKYKNWKMKDGYISFYLFNLFILSMVISTSFFSILKKSVYLILALVVIYTIWLIIYRPYQNSIHNIAIVTNQLVVILNIVWIVSQDYVYLKRSHQQRIAFILMGLMAIILLLAFVRIIFQLRKRWLNKPNISADASSSKIESAQNEQKQFLNALLAQTSNNINSYRIHAQLIRQQQLSVMEYEHKKRLKIRFNRTHFPQQQQLESDDNEVNRKIVDVNAIK